MAVLPKVLVFVRHAIAVDAEDFDGPDAERPLTKKGVKKAKKVLRKLAEHYPPTRIVTSPYVRARDTAAILMEALTKIPGAPGVRVDYTESLTPDASWEDWSRLLESGQLAFDADDVVCVVGHEPSLGLIFCRHIGFPEAIPFKKAGVGVIEPESLTKARLIAFAPARFF